MQINEKAVLVKLSIGMPGNTRKDPKLTSDVQREHKLEVKSGRWLKQLYPDEALEPINKLASEARGWHYQHSLPWADEGWRILPTAHHFDYTEQMRDFRHKYENLSETHFLGRYNDWLSWALRAHNGTFDAKDYPGVDKLRKKFQFQVEMQPVPSGDDFRVQLSADEMQVIRQQTDERVALAVEEAHKDLWRRLMDPVQRMAERLKEPDAVFRDTLVGNLREIVGLIPALNLKGDANLDALRAEVEQALCKHSPDTLRDSKPTRAQVAAQADAILKKMQGYCLPHIA